MDVDLNQKNSSGRREKALTGKNISLVYVDVTSPAQQLERSHLCGPAAGLVQSQALACVALIGAELSRPKETVTLRFRVSGSVAGVLVENIAGGGLRGYTNHKVLPEFDEVEPYDERKILGELGEMSVVRSIPGKTLSSAMINVAPASLKAGLKEYYTRSLQRSVDVVVETSASSHGTLFSRALLIECMPDGDKREFNRLSRKLEQGVLKDAFKSSCTIADICDLLGIKELSRQQSEPLEFKCRCSIERVQKMVSGLPDADIKDMIHNSDSTQIICHMCGESYRVGKELLWSILEKRGHDLDMGEEFDYD